jgi:2,3,4,5-tetrahydropyridine-2,6-dicarboxylate N-succinyltransferase
MSNAATAPAAAASSSPSLEERVEKLAASRKKTYTDEDYVLFEQFKRAMARGEIRAADRAADGAWKVNAWVKRGILLGFRMGNLVDMTAGGKNHFDKHTFLLRPTSIAENVRIVPGSTSIRDGSYLAPGVVIMPPCYVNVGAFVDEETMLDSHVLVGSCAQVGKRVHLSAAVQIGGVLEPPNALPVVVEDDCFIGGGCGIYEGTVIRRRAVLAPGVILTGSTTVFDLVKGEIYRRAGEKPLEVPEGAVVVPGSRPSDSPHAKQWGIQLYAPVIVKYRDEKTDASTCLEQALR